MKNLAILIAALMLSATSASAQSYGPIIGNSVHSHVSKDVRPMGDYGRFHGYLTRKPHSCTWSITSRCTSWRDGTGLQRHIERTEARRP
jgi:hypothetical protein